MDIVTNEVRLGLGAHNTNSSSVHYGASGAPKNTGPRPNSPPYHTEQPGAGRVFLGFPAHAPRPRPFPRAVPVKTGGGKWGPVKGMSGDSPHPVTNSKFQKEQGALQL